MPDNDNVMLSIAALPEPVMRHLRAARADLYLSADEFRIFSDPH